MERRSFITHSALASIGVFVAVSKLEAALAPFENSLKLPTPKTHLRHGTYDLSALKRKMLPNWITIYEPNRFLFNGYETSAKDISLFQFDLGSEAFVLGYDDEKVNLTTSDRTYTLDHQQQLSLSTNDYSVRILKGDHVHEYSNSALESVCIVLRGSAKFNGKKLEQNEFVSLSQKITHVKMSEDSLVVVVGKK